MDELFKIYQQYQEYLDAFAGEETDWEAQYNKIHSIVEHLKPLKFRRSERSLFYDYIRRCMLQEYSLEASRMYLKCAAKKKGKGDI